METQTVTLSDYLSSIRRPVIAGGDERLAAADRLFRRPNVIGNLIGAIQSYVCQHDLGKIFAEVSYALDGPRSRWSSGADALDLSIVGWERTGALDAVEWQPVPNLAVEVLSPTDLYSEVSQKVADYLRFGVKLVWVIDPAARTVRVHTPGEPLGHSLREADALTADPVIPGWSMKVAELFSDD